MRHGLVYSDPGYLINILSDIWIGLIYFITLKNAVSHNAI